MPRFNASKLLQFLNLHTTALPKHYTSQHGQWITMVQFIVCALDLIDNSTWSCHPVPRQQLIDHIYLLQHPNGGFLPAHNLIHPDSAATFSALACLGTLGDPLTRVNRATLKSWMDKLQNPDGGFRQFIHVPNRSDLRFVYSVLASHKFLGIRLSPIQRTRTIAYIKRLQTYEGGFGLDPLAESHGGYTYCAVASLFMMDSVTELPPQSLELLLRWAVNQQLVGFSGRINKPNDSCYSFWIGATLKVTLLLLGHYELIDVRANQQFLSRAQSEMGGFGKDASTFPDVMHTYMSLAAMSFIDPETGESPGHRDLGRIIPELTVTERAYRLSTSL